jgi:uncharacterized membrane protein YfcA
MLVPAMVYLLGMPAHVAVGTSLFQILFTCIGATVMQAGANHTVDVVLALIVALGSTVGAQIGARLGRFLRGEQLMGILGILALVVMLKMSLGLVTRPPNLLKKPAGVARNSLPVTRSPFSVAHVPTREEKRETEDGKRITVFSARLPQ